MLSAMVGMTAGMSPRLAKPGMKDTLGMHLDSEADTAMTCMQAQLAALRAPHHMPDGMAKQREAQREEGIRHCQAAPSIASDVDHRLDLGTIPPHGGIKDVIAAQHACL